MKTYLGWKMDYTAPAGEPAFAGPDSVSWRVFKNPVALGVGGVAAVLLEFADARIRSGVWDHSKFRVDPIGRSQRTGIAAMVGVYGPQSAARRVIQGVTNMHARVSGETPSGEAYKALDVELLDWVAATAAYGFVTAYDRFVAPLSEADQRRFFAEGGPVTRLYGATHPITSVADFDAMLAKLLPRMEAHAINTEFLTIIATAKGLPGMPHFISRAVAHAAVSILPAPVRTRLGLGPEWDLSPRQARLVRALAWTAERLPQPGGPPQQACLRLGLPGNFLYRRESEQTRLLAAWRAAQPINQAGLASGGRQA